MSRLACGCFAAKRSLRITQRYYSGKTLRRVLREFVTGVWFADGAGAGVLSCSAFVQRFPLLWSRIVEAFVGESGEGINDAY